MAIERDRFDLVDPAPAGRRYSHKQSPEIAVLTSYPAQYRATLVGTENGENIEVRGDVCHTREAATASAWEALRVWALAGRVPV